MREILFRGKRADNGAWETGFYVVERLGCSDARHCITDKMTGYHTPVVPETVGQFTGLLDKNGRPVYEGDVGVVDEWGSARCFVRWNKDAWIICYADGDDGFLGTVHSVLCVTGNIHDNPEMTAEVTE